MEMKPRLVILVAGVGKRLQPLTYRIPKALIQFDGISITEMCLEAFSELGVTEAALVVGHLADKIRERIGDNSRGIKIRYIYNPLYLTAGGAYSLWLARQFFQGRSCIIMDGDYLIDRRLLEKLMKAPYQNCLLVDDAWRVEDYTEETIVTGRDGVIEHLFWSPTGKLPQVARMGNIVGEAIVIVKLGAKASTTLSQEIDRYIREEAGELEHPEAFDRTFRRSKTWYITTEGLPWIEIDSHYDLETASNRVLPRIQMKGGENAK